jgi:gamma-tubulin complex component 4
MKFRYNEIFSYLLSIRRVQIELNQCFLLQMSSKRLRKTEIDPKIWLTRNHMSFLIDNLQFYLQADVLETQFMELENRIKLSKDFEQIRLAHDTFLTKIQSQSFVLHKSVNDLI